MLTRKSFVWGGVGAIAFTALFLSVRVSGDQSGAASTASSRGPVAPEASRPSPANDAEETAPPRSPAPLKSTQRNQRPSASPRADQQAKDADPLRAVRAGKGDHSSAGSELLISQLTSRDAIVVAEAANELVERRATQAIGALAAIDLEDAAGSGLSIIDALGRLGAVAEDGEKAEAVERLLTLLESEKQRAAPESAGNLLQLYEALGRTQDVRAAGALEAELVDPRVGRAPKVVIVQSLVWIGAPRSRSALLQARTLQAELPPADDFDAELRVELLGVLEAAIAAL